MLKHLLLVAVLFSAIACSSDKNSSNPSSQPAPQDTSLVTVNTAPISADSPNVYEFTSGPQGPLSIHIYSEDGIWIIEQNKIAEDGLPTPMGRWTFTTKEKAYTYAISKLGVSESQRNDSALDKDPSSDVLFSDNLSSGNVLWEVKNAWDWDWEVAFAKWMRANLHPAFFEQLGIENDCADAYYQARMIFSYENALPVSFRLAGGGAFFTQNVVRPEWKKLKTDSDWRKNKRFLKALDYIANTTYTHTLGRDTYPVEITKEGLIEGTAFLYLDKHSGHTLLVNEINLGDTAASKTRLPMYTLNSTVPKALRPLYEAMFYEPGQPQVSKYGYTGFVRFRWPKSSGAAALVDAAKMPYYSLEQYDPSFMITSTETSEEGEENNESTEEEYANFSLTVFNRLNPDFDPTLRITEGITEISEMMIARKDVVIEGYKVCQKGCVDGSADYENWSTPSRDKRIKGLLVDLEKYQSALYSIPSVNEAWTKALEKPIIDLEGINYALNHVKWTFANDFHSSDPNVTPSERWGLSPEAFALAAQKALNPQIEARNAKIKEKADCKTSPTCLLFSDEYIAKSTYIEDQDMQRAITERNKYCTIVSAELCDKFKATLATLPTAASAHANFLDTWEKIFLLNSDPTVTEAQRWGAMPQGYRTMTLSGSYSIVGKYKTKAILFKDSYPSAEISIVDESTEKFEVLSKLEKSGAHILNEKNGLLAVADYASAELAIYSMETLQKQVIQLPEVALEAEDGFYIVLSWTNSGALIATYQNKSTVFVLENGQYVFTGKVYDNFSALGGEGYLYSTYNQETNGDKPSKWQVQIVNALDTTQPEIEFLVSDTLGTIAPSYLSPVLVTNKAVLFSWDYYSNSESKSGHLRVDLQTGVVTNAPEMPKYLARNSDTVAYASIYNDNNDTTKTEFYFFNDDLTVDKVVSMVGSCDNCYSENLDAIKVGTDIYKIDIVKKEFAKTIEITGLPSGSNVSISSIYENLAVLSFYSNSENYSALYDLEQQKTLMTAENMHFTSDINGIIPMLSLSKNHIITDATSDAQTYYALNLIYDLKNISLGPIATPGDLYYGEDGEEGDIHIDIDTGMYEDIAGIAPLAPILKATPFKVNVLDPTAIKMKNEKLSIFTVSEYQTVIIFK